MKRLRIEVGQLLTVDSVRMVLSIYGFRRNANLIYLKISSEFQTAEFKKVSTERVTRMGGSFLFGEAKMKSIDGRFYKTNRWIKTRNNYFKSVNGLCERCLKNGLITPALIAHHKIHLNADNVKDESIAYGFDNLEALCLECHNKEHFGKSEKRYTIIDGELVFNDSQ